MPAKYAGQQPPDAVFYIKTFEKDQMSGKNLIRGLCIDNDIARRIDIFVDDLLRESTFPDEVNVTEKNSRGEEVDVTRVGKYWEVDYSKATQMFFDEPIVKPIVKEFECFQTKWMLDNNIPWCWQQSAAKIWVRNNRKEMFDNVESQKDKPKRRYPEFSEDTPSTPKKRAKKQPSDLQLIACTLVVQAYTITKIPAPAPRPQQKASQGVEPTYKLVPVGGVDLILMHMVKLLEDPLTGEQKAKSPYHVDWRYLDNLDINPASLKLQKVWMCIKALGNGEQGDLYAQVEEGKLRKISSDKELGDAMALLHQKQPKKSEIAMAYVAKQADSDEDL